MTNQEAYKMGKQAFSDGLLSAPFFNPVFMQKSYGNDFAELMRNYVNGWTTESLKETKEESV